MFNRKYLRIALIVASLFLAPAARAAGTENFPSPQSTRAATNPDYVAGKRAIDAKDWRGAIVAFSAVVGVDPGNANAHNFLAYAYRKSGELDPAFKHYQEALRLDPKHRGAHEYLGETYLLVNDVAKARAQLDALAQLCPSGCEEYDDLKEAVADYQKKHAAR